MNSANLEQADDFEAISFERQMHECHNLYHR